MSKQSIPVTWKKCCTCAHWTGERKTDTFCRNVEFDSSERGLCEGGEFNRQKMLGTTNCSKWEPQYRK